LNLELKRYDSNLKTLVDPVLKLLQKHWLDFDKLIISSFDQATLTYCHQQAPYLQLGQLYGKIPDNWLAQMQAINAVSCHCNHLHLQQSQVTDLKQAGYDVYCYTVNEPQLVENHWKWGIDGIFTDYPQRF
jgi:glycerophosphoryl diester phosphodiesterase